MSDPGYRIVRGQGDDQEMICLVDHEGDVSPLAVGQQDGEAIAGVMSDTLQADYTVIIAPAAGHE